MFNLYRLTGLFSLIASQVVLANNISFLNDVLPDSERGKYEFSLSKAKFDDNLDILNYADELTGTRPESADIDEWSASYAFENSLKITYTYNESSAKAVRPTIPRNLDTTAESEYLSLSYDFFTNEKRSFNAELFYTETDQDDSIIDCYQTSNVVIGGSCEEADVKLLDADIYKASGDRVYLPVLKTTARSEARGINIRIKDTLNDSFNLYHTIGIREEEVFLNFVSPILYTTDSFLRGIRVNGVKTGDLLDNFKNELPQQTPWKERVFNYSANLTYGLSESIALTARLSLIKVTRSGYEENPNKEDYTDNQLLDFGFFYEPQKNILLYTRLSLSSKYLVGLSSIAYNRKSNHLFDHPYGQLYIGSLIRF